MFAWIGALVVNETVLVDSTAFDVVKKSSETGVQVIVNMDPGIFYVQVFLLLLILAVLLYIARKIQVYTEEHEHKEKPKKVYKHREHKVNA